MARLQLIPSNGIVVATAHAAHFGVLVDPNDEARFRVVDVLAGRVLRKFGTLESS